MGTNNVLKVWLIVSTFSLLLLQTSVQSAPVSLQDENSDQLHNKYVMFNLLEPALYENKFNIYQLVTTFYSESLVLCLPVVYEIECTYPDPLPWNINCTSGYNITFLWTYFDTGKFDGKLLLYFTKNHLKSPLFGIRHKFCQFSPDDFGIKLYLKVGSFPESDLRGNYSVDNLISSTLLDITTKLKDYANAYGYGARSVQPALGGYSLPWNKTTENQFESDTQKFAIVIPVVLIPIAFVVGISGGRDVLTITSKRYNSENTQYYYFFWSFQFLAAFINIVHSWYIRNLAIALSIPAFALLYSIITMAVMYYLKAVPFTKLTCSCVDPEVSNCKQKKLYPIMICFVNALEVCNPFVLFVYMAYSLPWIILGFYLYPIKIIVRISAILTVALCIVGIIFVILRYFDKSIRSNEQRDSVHSQRERTGGETSPLLGQSAENTRQLTSRAKKVESVCNTFLATTKWVAGVLVLACFGFIGYLLHHIIFVFTNSEEEAVVQLIHILPLIIIPLGAFMIRHLILLADNAGNGRETVSVPQADNENQSAAHSGDDNGNHSAPLQELTNGSQHETESESRTGT